VTDSAPAARLFLGRHARTAQNAAGRIRGRSNPPLDEVGVEEARRMAVSLAGSGFAAVVSSPLDRAQHTGRIVAEAAGVPIVIDERLTDRDFARWTGELISDVEAEWGSVGGAPGVETVESVLARALPAVNEALDEYGSVVVISHDVVIVPLLEAMDALPAAFEIPTASWCELQRDAGGWRFVGRLSPSGQA
jgi:broad specificity phosphatase PhoE